MKIRWDLESLEAEAKKFKTRFAFQTQSRQAYEYARTRGLLDQIAGHMKPAYKAWDSENVKEEALKYSSRTNFAKGSRGAYLFAQRHEMLDEVCAHMKSKAV